MPFRSATLEDLVTAASWVTSAQECAFWSGPRVAFPFDIDTLRAAIDFDFVRTFALDDGGGLVGFGQIVDKADGRGHLARLIVAQGQRRRGHGKVLVLALVDEARAAGQTIASLNVDPLNAAAIALYTTLGFRPAPRPEDEPDATGSHYMELPLR